MTRGTDPQPWADRNKPVPAVPTGLAACAGATSAVLNWAPPPMPGGEAVAGYTIFQNGTAIGTTARTSYTVDGLTAGTGYVFTVAAVDMGGRAAGSAPVALLTQAGFGR